MKHLITLRRTLPRVALLVFLVPISFFLFFTKGSSLWLFVTSALSILGLVVIIGKATEEIALYMGPVWGGLLNATFGNITELIIAFMALQSGMIEIVRASITGSILGNLLLLLGLAMIAGGLKHKTQTFSRTGAVVNISMLSLTLVALVIPALAQLSPRLDPHFTALMADSMASKISLAISVVLLVIYALSLLFSLGTHRFAFMPEKLEEEKPKWGKWFSVVVLSVIVVLVAFVSDFFVEAIDHLVRVQHIPISELFIGVVIVAIVGNAAEGSVAITVARQNKMELAFQVAMGSCIQVALLVAPVLVIASHLIGKPMTLGFNIFEIAAIWAGVLIASTALQDGESNWFEGAMMVGVYVVFAAVFFIHP
ncbi:MAG: calcium/proton exchanger [Armatimonadetes bacterium]|nr:calcium/proton exchanger [Armatimonadota bacterium]